MKGDFTRFTHDPKKHYSGVLKQQGHVDVDADWNEYVQIQDYINRTKTKDVIGLCGVPNSTPDGFKIMRFKANTKLWVLGGRIYVDGTLCELDGKGTQLDLNPNKTGIYLAYLDVWQRHITAVEDPDLREIALGGPDTTTRVKTEWQVRLKDVSRVIENGKLGCKPFCCGTWVPEEAVSSGKLAAHAVTLKDEESLCGVPAHAGYQGLENRLYRVEIHTAGKAGSATFKWSRDNGSVVFPIEKFEIQGDKSTITLKQLGNDEVLKLHVGDWVEIIGDETELAFRPGIVVQVAPESDGTDLKKGVVVLKADISAHKDDTHLKIRRWDQKETSEMSLVNGAIVVTAGQWVPLEYGVEVCFKNGYYQTGDYWLIPARSRVRDVLWPKSGGEPEFQLRHGIEHHYCALALVRFTGRTWDEPRDCRRIFLSLAELSHLLQVQLRG